MRSEKASFFVLNQSVNRVCAKGQCSPILFYQLERSRDATMVLDCARTDIWTIL